MQRIPARSYPVQSGNVQEGEPSPLLRLARRIREEQGTEQVRAFLAAMTPFSAPNEIRRIGEGFGISYESIEETRQRSQFRPPAAAPAPPKQNADDMMSQINKLKMLMQLSGMMKNGGDPMSLLSLLGGRGN